MFLVKSISKERKYFSIGKDYTRDLSIIIHSDTLFSAICNNFRKLYGNQELEDFLKFLVQSDEQGKSLLELSSCFHYLDVYKQEKYFKTIYFLPKPLIKFPFKKESQERVEENSKLFKKIKFISFEIAKKIQDKEELSFSRFQILSDYYLVDEVDLEVLGLDQFLSLLQKKDLRLEKIERIIRKRISIFEIMEEQKVGITRISRESEPFVWPKMKFNQSKYYIKNGDIIANFEIIPGFYFILNYSDLNDDLIEKINASIKLIMDEGLGGKKSLGCGLFDDIEVNEINNNFQYYNLLTSDIGGRYINLSLIYPNKEELQNVEYFNLYGRSGFIFSADTISARFNDVNFIEEGAVFKNKIRGRLIQVATSDFINKYHKVYKNGIGMFLNIGKTGVE